MMGRNAVGGNTTEWWRIDTRGGVLFQLEPSRGLSAREICVFIIRGLEKYRRDKRKNN